MLGVSCIIIIGTIIFTGTIYFRAFYTNGLLVRSFLLNPALLKLNLNDGDFLRNFPLHLVYVVIDWEERGGRKCWSLCQVCCSLFFPVILQGPTPLPPSPACFATEDGQAAVDCILQLFFLYNCVIQCFLTPLGKGLR